jgi:hypothetical protein
MDASGRVLVFSNIFTILLAVMLGYTIGIVIWAYWLESVIIGVFAFLKLLIGGMRQPKMLPVSIALALFFLFHYGMFHLGYFIFLSALPWFSLDQSMMPLIALSAGILFASHAFSFYEHIFRKQEKIAAGFGAAAGLQFKEPYSRIVPIHLTIILSGFIVVIFGVGQNILLILMFMGLKTISDLHFHNSKHGLVRQPTEVGN